MLQINAPASLLFFEPPVSVMLSALNVFFLCAPVWFLSIMSGLTGLLTRGGDLLERMRIRIKSMPPQPFPVDPISRLSERRLCECKCKSHRVRMHFPRNHNYNIYLCNVINFSSFMPFRSLSQLHFLTLIEWRPQARPFALAIIFAKCIRPRRFMRSTHPPSPFLSTMLGYYLTVIHLHLLSVGEELPAFYLLARCEPSLRSERTWRIWIDDRA